MQLIIGRVKRHKRTPLYLCCIPSTKFQLLLRWLVYSIKYLVPANVDTLQLFSSVQSLYALYTLVAALDPYVG